VDAVVTEPMVVVTVMVMVLLFTVVTVDVDAVVDVAAITQHKFTLQLFSMFVGARAIVVVATVADMKGNE